MVEPTASFRGPAVRTRRWAVIEIDEPPDIRACAIGVPLVWLYSLRSGTWKSYEPVDGERDVIRRHRCDRHGQPDPRWRQLEFVDVPDPAAVERAHQGAAYARQLLASKENPS